MAEPKGLVGLVQEIFSDIKELEEKKRTKTGWELHCIFTERKSLCYMLKKVLQFGEKEIPEEPINAISAWCLEKSPRGNFILRASNSDYFYLACDLTRTYSTSTALKDEIFQNLLTSDISHEAELATVLAKEFYQRSLNDEEILRLVENYTRGASRSDKDIQWYGKMARTYGSEACQRRALDLLEEMERPSFY
ncbi:hypothetical protein HYS49_00515 [Candidatus Woesearchaeota archaeon]|nr:hypothetical protein [Candidatus Woesearchaeota archaeon]